MTDDDRLIQKGKETIGRMSFQRTEAKSEYGFALASRVPAETASEADSKIPAIAAFLASQSIGIGKEQGAFVHFVNGGTWPVVNFTQAAYDKVQQQGLGKAGQQK